MSAERATTLRLIKSIGFSDSYDDVVLFNSTNQQYSYFTSLPGKSYAEYSYQRPEAGYVKVSTPYDEIYDYAYLMFKNASHQNKWWYAFIDSVEYINEKTTGVRFHIDVMQSYMFNYELGESFVVREHPETDEPGDNIVPENVNFGEYVYSTTQPFKLSADKNPFGKDFEVTAGDLCIVVAYNPNVFTNDSDIAWVWKENVYGGVYQGVRYACWPICRTAGADFLAEYIKIMDSLIGSVNQVSKGGLISVFTMPIIFLPKRNTTSWENVRHQLSYERPNSIGGYTPKNKKLLTFPYIAINVTNMRTDGVDYAYEYFYEGKARFNLEGSFGINPTSICYPVGYRQKEFATEEGVSMEGYPIITWGQDGYTDWMSNHMFQTALSIGTTACVAGASAFMGTLANPAGAVMASIPGMTRAAAREFTATAPGTARAMALGRAPLNAIGAAGNEAVKGIMGAIPQMAGAPSTPGGVNSHDLLFGNYNANHINIRRKRITTEYAERLDDYFTRYGYATNQMKTPNLKSRPYFNHIQLKNPHFDNITCPMDVISTIASVYEKGVTFWRATATIGDYNTQDNSL